MENRMRGLEFFLDYTWFKVLGIGKEGCEIVLRLSEKSHYLSVGKENFICVKGLKEIDKLQNYLTNESHVWYVIGSGKAYQDVLKEVLKVTHSKVDYSLLFSTGKIDKSFIYSLLGRGYINHFIEPVEGACYDKTLKVVESLLFLIFGSSLICIDLVDVESAFSVSPFVKVDVIDISKKDVKNYELLEHFCKKLKNPASLVLSLMMPDDITLDDIYSIANFFKEKFRKSLLKLELDRKLVNFVNEILRKAIDVSTGKPINLRNLPDENGIELFFFSSPLNGTLREGTIRLAAFWTEKE